MEKERRIGLCPVPDQLLGNLNTVQITAFRRMEAFGWQLKFARRAPPADPVLVLYNPSDGGHALLDGDGSVVPMTDIRFQDTEDDPSA